MKNSVSEIYEPSSYLSGNTLQDIIWLMQYVRFEVFTAATMKNAVFWDVTQCGS
jgi:hypothetical protein